MTTTPDVAVQATADATQAVDALGALAGATTIVHPMAPAAEPGYKTTEFYVTPATEGMAALAAFHVVTFSGSQQTGILGAVGVAAAYVISRGVRKRGTSG